MGFYSNYCLANFQGIKILKGNYFCGETQFKLTPPKLKLFAQSNPSEAEPEPVKIFVREIEVTGSTVFDGSDFDFWIFTFYRGA